MWDRYLWISPKTDAWILQIKLNDNQWTSSRLPEKCFSLHVLQPAVLQVISCSHGLRSGCGYETVVQPFSVRSKTSKWLPTARIQLLGRCGKSKLDPNEEKVDRHNRIDWTCMILYVFCMNMTRAQDSCPIVAGISNCLSVRIFTVSPRKQVIFMILGEWQRPQPTSLYMAMVI